MTLLRRLAVSTLRTVIWLSSSSTRKWAEAMLAEMECIDGDGAAFLWAMGSLRLLFVEQPTPAASLAEIPAAARMLAGRMNMRFRFSLLSLGSMLIFFTHYGLRAANTLQQTGAVLVGASMLYLFYQVVSARPKPVPAQADLSAQIMLYRSELMRERNFHRGRSLWTRLVVTMPGFSLLCLGTVSAYPSTARTQILCLAFYFFFTALAIPNNLRFAKRYARQLHDLDVLESKSE